MTAPTISESSRRIARNTVLLYFRMLVMIVIGLISYRIILKALGVSDYGVYSAVGGVVTMAMLVMNTVSSAISRFVTVSLGEGDLGRLRKVIGTSLAIMAGFCLLIALLTETVGMWYLTTKMDIPLGRMEAARAVLHASAVVLVLQLLSIPFTADINAHEDMGAYAWLSILEAVLKLAVALLVWISPADKLVVYVWLLAAATLVSRGGYALYAFVKYPESRRLGISGPLVREMGSFAGWNFLGSGAYMLNTQGVNQLMNLFFGVGMNAARGVADKVEQVVRQFATNIALALNPALTKSYVDGRRDYAYDLACKGAKYYFWVLWVLAIPFFTDAETILRLWVGEVPDYAALFTRLTLLCFLIDFTPGTLNILEQAEGRIRKYYLVASCIAVLVFPITYVAFRLGAPAWIGYVTFVGVYVLKAVAMLLLVHRDTGFPIGMFLRKAVVPILAAVLLSVVFVMPLVLFVPVAWWRFLLTAFVGVFATAAAAWLWGLSEGEKGFVSSKLPWQRK